MSTLYDAFNGPGQMPQQPQMQPAPAMNQNFFNQLRQFASTFSGNPMHMVQSYLRSGQMTQQQFEEYGKQASQILNSFRG